MRTYFMLLWLNGNRTCCLAHAGDAVTARHSTDAAAAASAPQRLPMAPSDPWDFAALQPPREPALGASEAELDGHAGAKPCEGPLRRGGGGSGVALGGTDAGRNKGVPDGSAALALSAKSRGTEPPGNNGAAADGMSSLVPPEVRWDPATHILMCARTCEVGCWDASQTHSQMLLNASCAEHFLSSLQEDKRLS